MNTQALNLIAAKMGTTDKEVVINVAIACLVKLGSPIDQAVDAILGEGTYKKFADKVWDHLQSA